MDSIKVKGKSYKFKFDYLAVRKFAKEVGIKKPAEIETFFSKMDLNDPSFDDIDNIAVLIRSAIKSNKIPSLDDIIEELATNPDSLTGAISSFGESASVDVSDEGEKK